LALVGGDGTSGTPLQVGTGRLTAREINIQALAAVSGSKAMSLGTGTALVTNSTLTAGDAGTTGGIDVSGGRLVLLDSHVATGQCTTFGNDCAGIWFGQGSTTPSVGLVVGNIFDIDPDGGTGLDVGIAAYLSKGTTVIAHNTFHFGPSGRGQLGLWGFASDGLPVGLVAVNNLFAYDTAANPGRGALEGSGYATTWTLYGNDFDLPAGACLMATSTCIDTAATLDACAFPGCVGAGGTQTTAVTFDLDYHLPPGSPLVDLGVDPT
jgi:hypothetical protein